MKNAAKDTDDAANDIQDVRVGKEDIPCHRNMGMGLNSHKDSFGRPEWLPIDARDDETDSVFAQEEGEHHLAANANSLHVDHVEHSDPCHQVL